MRSMTFSMAVLGVGGGGHHFLRSEFAVGVGQGDGGLRGTDVDADDDAVVVEAQEGGPAAARQASGGSFEDPVAFDQVFDDEGDGAALQAGNAGEVGAGDGLLRADEVEHDAAVDVADAFSGGEMDAGFVGDGHGRIKWPRMNADERGSRNSFWHPPDGDFTVASGKWTVLRSWGGGRRVGNFREND